MKYRKILKYFCLGTFEINIYNDRYICSAISVNILGCEELMLHSRVSMI